MEGEINNILGPPESVNGITKLNKKLFEKQITLKTLNIVNSNSESSTESTCKIKVSDVLPTIKKYLLKLIHFKAIVSTDNANFKAYLNPEIINKWSDFPLDVQKALENLNLNESNLQQEDFTLTYEHYSAEAVLKAVLPKDKEGISSFTKVGHIVHVNLREHLLLYKEVVGEVLFDKVPNCKSVVNKVNMIDNTYRNFSMEVLKGSSDMLTTVRENHCQFAFDFSTVYWNSRLCTEHERIVEKIRQRDVFFDVFAGVGPFSIPCAKKKCTTFANDLNPESFKWLNHNKKLNKVGDEYLKTYNLDGKDFILSIVKLNLREYLSKNDDRQVYIAMNLPALAVEFLPNFIGLFENNELPEHFKPPVLFVYCFAKGENVTQIAKDSVIENLKKKINSNCDVSSKITEIFSVRTVSSMKDMMRVTVILDRDILVGKSEGKEGKYWGKDAGESRGIVEGEGEKRGRSESGEEGEHGGGCFKKCRVEADTKGNGAKDTQNLVGFDWNHFGGANGKNIRNMGKNKKKVSNVFKVAGAKSLKLKAKAKIVKTELKDIKIKNKEKVLEIDKALVQLQEKVRQSKSDTDLPKQNDKLNQSKLPTVNSETSLETQKSSEENMAKLDSMQLS